MLHNCNRHAKGNHQSQTDEVGGNLPYGHFQKDQSTYSQYSGMESDINDVWKSGIVFSNSTCTCTELPPILPTYMPHLLKA